MRSGQPTLPNRLTKKPFETVERCVPDNDWDGWVLALNVANVNDDDDDMPLLYFLVDDLLTMIRSMNFACLDLTRRVCSVPRLFPIPRSLVVRRSFWRTPYP